MLYTQAKALSYWSLTSDPRYKVVTTSSDFEEMMGSLRQQKIVAYDYETSGLQWYRQAAPCGIAFSGHIGEHATQNYYVPYRHITGEKQLDPETVIAGSKELLENREITKVAHNIKFDDHMARREGIQVLGPRHDTMIMARLLDENQSAGLKHRALVDLGDAQAHLHEELLDREVVRLAKASGLLKTEYKDRFGYAGIPIDLCGRYGAQDTEYTAQLYNHYVKRGVPTYYQRIYATEMELTRILCDVEESGMLIDRSYLEQLKAKLLVGMQDLELKIWDVVGAQHKFDLDSDAELRFYLESKLKAKLWKKTKKGGKMSVDAEVLRSLAQDHPVLELIRQRREAAKIATTYTDSILKHCDEEGLCHCNYQQVGTDTGRLSCREPNLQNQSNDSNDRAVRLTGSAIGEGGHDPWSVKRAYLIPEGYARIYLDYSQIELRVLAAYTQDPIMVDAYLHDADIHARTCEEVFGEHNKHNRRIGKIINFGLSYCLTAEGLSRQAGIPRTEASAFMGRFESRYAGIPKYRETFWEYVRQNGGTFDNLWGRTRRIPAITSSAPWEKRRAERKAIGSLIQGTAAELTKESLVRIDDWIHASGSGAKIKQTVHDEIAIDTPLAEVATTIANAKALMEDYTELNPIPVKTDVAYSVTNWSEKRGV